MKRREFLAECALGAALAAGCRREPPTRQAVLKALVHEVVAPATKAVVTTSTELDAAVTAFANEPSVDRLRTARGKFKTTLLAWKRAQCFRLGPMVDTNAFVRSLFWPPRSETIEAVLDGANAIDEGFVANLGVDARGVYALEYLLFPLQRDEAATSALFGGDAGARRRQLARALAANVEQYASKAGRTLGDGAAYAARFAQGAQISLSILINQMIGTIENLSAHRLDLVLLLEQKQRLKPQEVEGWPSGSSHEIALAQLSGNEALYRGGKSGGLVALTRAMAPAIEERVSQRYAEALRAVRALEAPLERVVKTNRAALEAAAQATKALELAIKVDLASALGVTITFQTGDGD
jgi:predicted lipoprotein